jgi:lysozyme family protein
VADVDFQKRNWLRLAGASAFGLFVGQRAFAQDGRILGIDVPRQILDIIPRKPLNYMRLADAVIRLEVEADRKGLPQSSLALGKGQSIADLAESAYRLALPRLVALIDRSEETDPGFADKAGALLAELHQGQHEIPEMLSMKPMGVNMEPSILGLPMFMNPQAYGNASVGPTLELPTQAEVAAPPVEQLPVPEVPPVVETLPAPVEPPVVEAPKVELPKIEDEPDAPLSRSREFANLKGEYRRLFRKLQVRPAYQQSADWHLTMIRKARARYERVAVATGVPWHFIAVTHGLEASFNFRAHLHNGDHPLTARTRQVPAGRPSVWLPPSDWESSAKDALRLLGYTGQKDWSLERTLYRLEAYNGLGYRGLGVPTPYLWSFSNHYDRGKFVADGKFSHTAKSQQCGAAVMLKMLADAGEIKLESAV